MGTCELDRELHASVLKREESKEAAFREERDKIDAEFHEKLGMGGSEMTQKELRKIIDGDRRMYYRTEDLNDKLYIHYKGWRELKNLDGWTGLKTLYAECNAFSRMTGLQTCTKMRSLFLQENCINKISGLEAMPELWSLNLSSNFIERIEGLEGCKGLNTLMIAKNKIGFGGIADVEKLADTNICSLDIQDNRIDDPDVVPEVLMRMKALRVLYLKGNECAKKIVNYRKSLTVYCTDLRYLDDRPVFEDDRRAAEAFNRGGLEEQRAEMKRIKEEKSEKHERNMRAFSEMIENSRREKKERDFMRAEDKYTDDTDPVESFERRAKRLNNEWKEENKADLQDDARIHAEKVLRAEKEKREGGGEAGDTAAESLDTGAAETVDDKTKEAEDNRTLVYEDIWDNQPSGAQPAEPEKRPAEDNRKLVYDDIWDDAIPAVSSSPAGASKSPGPASNDGVFMPWAEGAVGMDALPPTKEVLEKRKATLQSKAEEAAHAEAGTASGEDGVGKATWHSKYLEQVAKTQAKLQVVAPTKAIFAPPPRKAEPPAEAEAASPPMGAGELDEMD